MTASRETDRSNSVLLNDVTALSDEALDHAVGGLNPQPLPPREAPAGEDMASPKSSWGFINFC
jgi:hypothetical protein